MKLKNYSNYLNIIKDYCTLCQIKLVYKNIKTHEGDYNDTHKIITVDDNLDDSEEIAVLLHELGHFECDNVATSVQKKRIGNIYFKKSGGGTLSKKEGLSYRKCEDDAWEQGRIIAKRLKIRLGKWYDEE